MATATKLGEVYVEFTAKGKEKTESDIDATTDKIKKAQLIVAGAYAAATASVLAWVRAGLQGTTVGDALSQRFQLLSREIASLFLPVLLKIIQALDAVINWFRGLSAETQRTIGIVVAATLGLAAFGAILPVIATGLKAVLAAGLPFTSILVLIAGLLGGGAGESMKGFGASANHLGAALGNVFEAAKPLVSVFANVLPAAIDLIAVAIDALATVMDSFIGKWAILSAAVIAFGVSAIPAAISGIGVLVKALYSAVVATWNYVVAQITALAVMGPAGWAILAGAAVAAAAGMAMVAAMVAGTPGHKKGGAKDSLAQSGSGFEGVQETYKRLQMGGVKDTTGLLKESNDLLREIEHNTRHAGDDDIIRRKGGFGQFIDWMAVHTR